MLVAVVAVAVPVVCCWLFVLVFAVAIVDKSIFIAFRALHYACHALGNSDTAFAMATIFQLLAHYLIRRRLQRLQLWRLR